MWWTINCSMQRNDKHNSNKQFDACTKCKSFRTITTFYSQNGQCSSVLMFTPKCRVVEHWNRWEPEQPVLSGASAGMSAVARCDAVEMAVREWRDKEHDYVRTDYWNARRAARTCTDFSREVTWKIMIIQWNLWAAFYKNDQKNRRMDAI